MMQKEAPLPTRAVGGVVETIKTVVWAVAIAVVIRTVAFEPFTIPSGSMIPTLLIGDFVFVSKFSYGYSRWSFPFGLAPFEGRVLAREPARGDVIVFRLPSNTSVNYIKRLVGLPNDRIQVREGVLHINGVPVPRKRETACDARAIGAEHEKGFVETLPNGRQFCVLQNSERPEGPANNTVELRVPSGHYFFMGDNRDNSLDSRFPPSQWAPESGGVGFVPAANLVGRADLIWFSIAWAPGDWSLGANENRVVWIARYWWLVVKSLPSIRFRRMFSGID
jgi:signal peptidase I